MELVATCLIKVGDRVKDSSALLSELHGHGVVNHVTRLIDVNSRITLSQSTYTVSYVFLSDSEQHLQNYLFRKRALPFGL